MVKKSKRCRRCAEAQGHSGYIQLMPLILLVVVGLLVGLGVVFGIGGGEGGDGGSHSEQPTEDEASSPSPPPSEPAFALEVVVQGDDYYVEGRKVNWEEVVSKLKSYPRGTNVLLRGKEARKKPFYDLIEACKRQGIRYEEQF